MLARANHGTVQAWISTRPGPRRVGTAAVGELLVDEARVRAQLRLRVVEIYTVEIDVGKKLLAVAAKLGGPAGSSAPIAMCRPLRKNASAHLTIA